MREYLKRLFTKKPSQTTLLENRLTEIESKIAAEQTKAAELTEQLNVAQLTIDQYEAKDAEERKRREGPEPWVEIKSADYSEVKGIQIELDWNDAFIQYLKENGITGKDEDVIVQKWLAILYKDVVERIEFNVIDRSDQPRIRDYE